MADSLYATPADIPQADVANLQWARFEAFSGFVVRYGDQGSQVL